MKTKQPILLLILTGLLVTGCNIKPFVTPSWDVNVKVPLINKKYFVSDLIDSVNIFAGDNNGIYVQSEGDFVSNPLDDIPVVLLDQPQAIPLLSGEVSTGTIPLSNVQDTIRISYGIISAGTLNYCFSDLSENLTSAYVVFPEIKNSDNVPLSIVYDQIHDWRQISLAGYHIGFPGSNIILAQLTYELHVISSLAPGSYVGNLQIDLAGNVAFSYLRGRVTSYRINMNNSEAQVDIEYPIGIGDAVNITKGVIKVTVHNPFSFACLMHGEIYGKNDFNEEVIIPVPLRNINASTDSSGFTRIEFTDNVDELLNVMPTSVELRNAYFSIYNPYNIIGELNSDSLITGTYVVRTPLTFEILSGSIIPQDSVKIEISDDNQELITNNVQSVQMNLSILNQLDIAAELTMYFSEDPDFNPINPNPNDSTYFSKTIHITSRSYPNLFQEMGVDLDNSDVRLFGSNSEVYMRMRVRFDVPPDGQPVTITASTDDYIQLRCMLSVKAHIED